MAFLRAMAPSHGNAWIGSDIVMASSSCRCLRWRTSMAASAVRPSGRTILCPCRTTSTRLTMVVLLESLLPRSCLIARVLRRTRAMRQDRGSNDSNKTTIVNLVEVVRHGQRIVLPEGLTAEAAIEVLQRKQRQEEEAITMSEPIHAFPWDGAIALKKAMEQTYGVAFQ